MNVHVLDSPCVCVELDLAMHVFVIIDERSTGLCIQFGFLEHLFLVFLMSCYCSCMRDEEDEFPVLATVLIS